MPTIGKAFQKGFGTAKNTLRDAWKELKVKIGVSKRADKLANGHFNPLYKNPLDKGGDNPLYGLKTTCPQNLRREPYSYGARSTTIRREPSIGCSESESIPIKRNRGMALQQATGALNYSEAELDSLLDSLGDGPSESQ